MNYYLRYNNQTLGPLAEQQIANLLQQGRFDDSVRFSTDLSRWYSASEIATFRTIQLPTGRGPTAAETSNARRFVAPAKQNSKRGIDHSLLYFFGFCLVAVLGFTAIIYSINQDETDSPSDPVITSDNYSADSLPSVYQRKQRAIGLVTLTFQAKEGGLETVPIGTAFAIGKNRFVTNAHVAYAVKNGFEETLVTPVLINYFSEEAKKQGKSYAAYLREIGDRGIEQARTKLLEFWKERGVKIRDIEIRLNHSHGEGFRVSKVQVHPRYNPNGKETGEFDVAIFEISGRTNCFFEIASGSELHGLTAGTPVASAGFPMEGLENGDLNIDKPEASYASGDIKKITDFENKDAGAHNNKSITHSIPAAGGASGSPIFTSNGKVVAVLWGVQHGFRNASGRVPSGLLHNRAVRIDQIKYMSEPVPWQSWVNDPTKTITLNNLRRERSPVPKTTQPVARENAPRTPTRMPQRGQSDDYAKAKAEYDRIVTELTRRNQKLAEILNTYDAVKLLAQMAVLSGNVSPSEAFKLNKKMKELELAIEQEKAALARLNARKEELRIRYNL